MDVKSALVDYMLAVIRHAKTLGYLAHTADCEINDGHANCTCGYTIYMSEVEEFLNDLLKTT